MSQRDSGYERKERDLYETPAWVTIALVPHISHRSLAVLCVLVRPLGAAGGGIVKDVSFLKLPCFVYALIDPFDDEPFYVGISINPWSRFDGHKHDPCSAAWLKIKELIEDGWTEQDILQVLGEFPRREQALFVERGLIQEFPMLLNRDNRGRAAA